MSKDNLIELKNPEPFIADPITEILRNGAKKLLAEALEAEIAGFLSQYRIRDHRPGDESDRIRFSSSILPPYLRKTKSMEELIPWLYLKGISTGDFSEALAALVGKDTPGLSAPTISRLKTIWQEDLKNVIYPINDMYIFGLTASTAMFAWKKGNAFWLSLAQQKKAKRNYLPLKAVSGKVSCHGRSFCLI